MRERLMLGVRTLLGVAHDWLLVLPATQAYALALRPIKQQHTLTQ